MVKMIELEGLLMILNTIELLLPSNKTFKGAVLWKICIKINGGPSITFIYIRLGFLTRRIL